MAHDPLAAMVHVLGARHSGAQALCADLSQALPQYQIRNASPEWLTAAPPHIQAAAAPPHAQAAAAPPHAQAAPVPHCWLLCGLDLACPAPEQALQQREDAALRAQLASAGLVFRMVYGMTPQQRLSQALQAIDAVAPCAATAAHRASAASQRLRAMCEQCSDPDCERRLFSALK